jgi:hypothetical protein
MMKDPLMNRKLSAVISGFIFGSWSHLSAAQVQSEMTGLTQSAVSVAGRELTLSFSQDTVTAAVKNATLCGSPQGQVTLAKLWMPDMGHGSSPTNLIPQNGNCTRIERLNFLMSGTWELRISFADGDSGVFTFDVAA